MAGYGIYAPSYGAARNPWAGKQLNDAQKVMFEKPQTAFATYLTGYNTSGQNAVSPNFRSFVESWLPQMYQGYEGQQWLNPDLSFVDYMGDQDPSDAYQLSNPNQRGMRAYRGTRYLSR
jgi:hypothetical protein